MWCVFLMVGRWLRPARTSKPLRGATVHQYCPGNSRVVVHSLLCKLRCNGLGNLTQPQRIFLFCWGGHYRWYVVNSPVLHISACWGEEVYTQKDRFRWCCGKDDRIPLTLHMYMHIYIWMEKEYRWDADRVYVMHTHIHTLSCTLFSHKMYTSNMIPISHTHMQLVEIELAVWPLLMLVGDSSHVSPWPGGMTRIRTRISWLHMSGDLSLCSLRGLKLHRKQENITIVCTKLRKCEMTWSVLKVAVITVWRYVLFPLRARRHRNVSGKVTQQGLQVCDWSVSHLFPVMLCKNCD